MPMAAWFGTTVRYTNYYNSVFLEKQDGTAKVVDIRLFESLFYRIDGFYAALKTDCIEYITNDPIAELFDYPEWYIQLVEEGTIRSDCGMDVLYSESGDEIYMNPRSVILRNFKGDIRYMEYDEFSKYYDFSGSEFIE